MRSKAEIVAEAKDGIANGMLQAIWQELFKQDYTECLLALAHQPLAFNHKLFYIRRGPDCGSKDSYVYPWTVKGVTTEGMWEIGFHTVDTFGITLAGNEVTVYDFEILDCHNHEYDDLMREFIEFVTHILSTRHPGGAPLEIPDAPEIEYATN